MSNALDKSLTFRELYKSSAVRVRGYVCRAPRSGPAAEEQPHGHNIVLLRRGVFRKHLGRESVTADVNHAMFFNEGSPYQISHPVDCGNCGTVFTLLPEMLEDIISIFNPEYSEKPGTPFPFAAGPCHKDVFRGHRKLLSRLENADTQALDAVWVDEMIMELMAGAIDAAFTHHSGPVNRRRPSTVADHRDRTEAAKSFLASHLHDPVKLEDVARAVHTSPFHLSRLFRQQSGVTVHRYLTQLRLRAAHERLAGGEDDLSALAFDLGFSSHGHFTNAFRREYGQTPSAVRSRLQPRMIRN